MELKGKSKISSDLFGGDIVIENCVNNKEIAKLWFLLSGRFIRERHLALYSPEKNTTWQGSDRKLINGSNPPLKTVEEDRVMRFAQDDMIFQLHVSCPIKKIHARIIIFPKDGWDKILNAEDLEIVKLYPLNDSSKRVKALKTNKKLLKAKTTKRV